MQKETAMAIYTEAIKSGNTAKFIAELNAPDGYHVLDEQTEELLIIQGTREMVKYYLISHPVWSKNKDLFKKKWPDLYAQHQARFEC